MKIFVTSDIHGSYEIWDKLNHLTKEDCGMLILAGDLYGKDYNFTNTVELAVYQEQDYLYMITVLNNLKRKGIQSLYINGNDDYYSNEDDDYHLQYTVEIEGFKYVPFPYVGITPWHTRNELDDAEILDELERLSIDENTFIVGHMMPYGIGDAVNFRNVGSISYKKFIQENNQILAVFGGHLHECGLELGLIGSTMIFNCASEYQSGVLRAFIIDTETLDFEEYID